MYHGSVTKTGDCTMRHLSVPNEHVFKIINESLEEAQVRQTHQMNHVQKSENSQNKTGERDS